MAHDHGPDCKCCTDGPAAFWADLEDKIAKSGHAILSTMTTLPIGDVSMAYTIGLADAGLPELLVFGLPPQVALVILNDAAQRLRKGRLPTDTLLTELATLPTVFKAVAPAIAEDFIIQANNRASRALPALQLIWPDRAGRFPWEPGADPHFAEVQPVLYQRLS